MIVLSRTAIRCDSTTFCTNRFFFFFLFFWFFMFGVQYFSSLTISHSLSFSYSCFNFSCFLAPYSSVLLCLSVCYHYRQQTKSNRQYFGNILPLFHIYSFRLCAVYLFIYLVPSLTI